MTKDLRHLQLRDYLPGRQVRTTQTTVERSSVPSIDAHNHLGTWLSEDGTWLAPDVEALIDTMQHNNVAHIVNLDGRWAEELDSNLSRYDDRYPALFSTYCQMDLEMLLLAPAEATRALILQLKQSAARGAKGLKVWKNLGLSARNADGKLVMPDSLVLHPVFEAAGELGLPVTIHTADPIAFFEPLDRHNERLEDLIENPEWWFGAPGFPGFDRLIDSLEAVIAAHPETTFVGAHVGCAAEDLARVSRMLDDYPHYNIDLGARMAELGRQPRATQRMIIDHPRQVLWGTDDYPVSTSGYSRWFRFLETADECFSYADESSVPSMGRWEVSGIDLPADVLAQIYFSNAARVLQIDM